MSRTATFHFEGRTARLARLRARAYGLRMRPVIHPLATPPPSNAYTAVSSTTADLPTAHESSANPRPPPGCASQMHAAGYADAHPKSTPNTAPLKSKSSTNNPNARKRRRTPIHQTPSILNASGSRRVCLVRAQAKNPLVATSLKSLPKREGWSFSPTVSAAEPTRLQPLRQVRTSPDSSANLSERKRNPSPKLRRDSPNSLQSKKTSDPKQNPETVYFPAQGSLARGESSRAGVGLSAR